MNPRRRTSQHNNRESGYTARGVPWQLVWMLAKPSVEKAELLEKKIKNLTRERKIRFMQKYADGIVDEDLLNSLTQKH